MSNPYQEKAASLGNKRGRGKWIMSTNSPGEPFAPFACRVDGDRTDEKYLSYPLARAFSDGNLQYANWTESLLKDYCRQTLTELKEVYGGEWVLYLGGPPKGQSGGMTGPTARKEAERIIMEGQDSPGKRFLKALKSPGEALGKALAAKVALPPAVDRSERKTAQRVDIDRLREPVVTGQGPVAFDPNDPELKGD